MLANFPCTPGTTGDHKGGEEMSLYRLLQERKSMNKPIRIGIIGAGAFGSAFLSQARVIQGMQVVSIADLDLEKAKRACVRAGWPEEAVDLGDSTSSINAGAAKGKVMVTDNSDHLIRADLDVIVEATGATEAGTYHAWTALEAGKDVVMGNVETDALLGNILKKKADEKGLFTRWLMVTSLQ
jgi:predicted homoserine dehydrogenase-like protein